MNDFKGAPRRDGYVPDLGVCPACSKWRYSSRAYAKKKAARRFHPGDRLSVYQCPADSTVWHFGHLPNAVRRGVADRKTIRNRQFREGQP